MNVLHDGNVVIPHLEVADRFWRRLLGYMGRAVPPAGHALYLTPCRSIHTFFMRFPIDVIFLDRNGRIINTLLNLSPWRIALAPTTTTSVIELSSGCPVVAELRPGDTLILHEGFLR